MNKAFLIILLALAPLAAAEGQKVLVLDLFYSQGNITVTNTTVMYGFSPDQRYQPEYGYLLEIWSDERLYDFVFKQPNLEYREGTEDGQLRGGLIVHDEVRFALVVPYYENMKEIRLYAPDGKLAGDRSFRESSKQRWIPAGVILGLTLLAAGGYLLVRRKLAGKI